MLTISKSFLKRLAAALREEPSLRPDTELLAEQLTIIVLQLEQEERGEAGEWR